MFDSEDVQRSFGLMNVGSNKEEVKSFVNLLCDFIASFNLSLLCVELRLHEKP